MCVPPAVGRASLHPPLMYTCTHRHTNENESLPLMTACAETHITQTQHTHALRHSTHLQRLEKEIADYSKDADKRIKAAQAKVKTAKQALEAARKALRAAEAKMAEAIAEREAASGEREQLQGKMDAASAAIEGARGLVGRHCHACDSASACVHFSLPEHPPHTTSVRSALHLSLHRGAPQRCPLRSLTSRPRQMLRQQSTALLRRRSSSAAHVCASVTQTSASWRSSARASASVWPSWAWSASGARTSALLL